MRSLSLKVVPAALALCVCVALLAARFSGSSQTVSAAAEARPVLVELFTSEGCSSCPPADALLRELDGTTTNGRRVIALSEHVTYWNSLGWADPFSTDSSTQRQNAYGERFRLDSVYTPQAVVNGSRQLVGSNRGALLAAIGSQAALETDMLRIVSLERETPQKLRVTYSLTGKPPDDGVDVMAAVADDLDQTHVLRGENAGTTLRHVSVVRQLVPLGSAHRTADTQTAEIDVPAGGKGSQHVVLFAQAANLGPVLSVDARPLR